MHFFCDSLHLTNRGNGYFVWFRVDQDQLEIYEVINDVFTLRASFPDTLNAGQTYDWKVSYDRITGVMEVWQDDVFLGSWTDATPKANGDYISLRSGNSNYKIDFLHVYRSRFTNGNPMVTVGDTLSDIRYQSLNSNWAGVVRSIVKDSARNISATDEEFLLVDWTAPVTGIVMNDGPSADRDTTFNLTQLEANWGNATDPHSGIQEYFYSFGTTPGDSDVVAWTSAGMNMSVVVSQTLVPGQWYYLGVRSKNGAGLMSSADTSDGQIADLGLMVQEQTISFSVYPNPASDLIHVSVSDPQAVTVKLMDMQGRVAEVPVTSTSNGWSVNVQGLSAGAYLLIVSSQDRQMVTPIEILR